MYKPEISKNHAALHDLIERWNKACDETYIVSGCDKFWMTHRAAEALAHRRSLLPRILPDGSHR